ncbi:MAG: calcium/sodium antiporter [Floccifex porci]|uniref:calcium/sodium antiporter n=1 Tax=Floccifex porci TaxID=2606629 RepID=UPI0023EFE539|nr:calcium/sodium antiporter [Floccifex porci]MDD7466352.1 calcium/sodium antiporter [Floccifex porci]
MNLLTALLLLVLGFVLLIKGADFFVDGASSVAKKFRIPSIIIGFTIVAMGTSLPECAVSVTASLANNNALAISNVVGSNIFNLMVVCGASAIFAPLAIQKSTLLKEFPFSIFCALLLLVLGYTSFNLGRMEGIVLLVLFLVYLLWMIFSALKNRQEIDEDVNILPTWKCLLFIIGGAIAIKYGGDFVVDGASFIATKMGFSQNLIGLTIVALGTSLPELVTSIVAARKNEVDMALGNAIGSNIFNILLVLGVAGAISPVAFIMENVIDIILLTIMSAYVWILAWTKNHINKTEGISMILIYVIYLVYICIR